MKSHRVLVVTIAASCIVLFMTALAGCDGYGISVSSVTPAAGPPSGGTEVTIAGSNFDSDSTVTFGGNAATDVTYVDGGTLTALTPAGEEGAVDVSVVGRYGTRGTLADGFTYRMPSLTVTVVDRDGVALPNALVMLGTDPTTDLQGTTDAAGQISFLSEELDDVETITAGLAGYRNFTIIDFPQPEAAAANLASGKEYDYTNAEPWEISMTLSQLSGPHGWLDASISDWDGLADNCPAPPAPPCIVRFAWINVPATNMSDSIDSTDCEACIGQSPFFIPFFGAASMMVPAFLEQTEIHATAGLLDATNFEIAVTKFGHASFSIDSTNTAANPKAVGIPLTVDTGDDRGVTIDLTAVAPAPEDEFGEMLLINDQPHGLSPLSAFLGMNLGGTEISEFAYRFPGLDPAQVAADPDLADSTYLVRAEVMRADGTSQSYNNTAQIIDAQQTFTIDALLGVPDVTSPDDGSVLPDDRVTDVSWDAGGDATNLYMVSIGTIFIDGDETESDIFWDVAAPPDVTSFTLPELPADSLPEFESCRSYRVEMSGLALTGFDFADGEFGSWDQVFLGYVPVLDANNQIYVFTPGDACGPLITMIDPVEGDAAGGDAVTISGMYFGDDQGDSTVTFAANPAAVTSWSNSAIEVVSPVGVADTSAAVIVTVDGQASNSGYFRYENP